jgi:hypothetical protein
MKLRPGYRSTQGAECMTRGRRDKALLTLDQQEPPLGLCDAGRNREYAFGADT